MCGKSPGETSIFDTEDMQSKVFSYKTDLADRVRFHASIHH